MKRIMIVAVSVMVVVALVFGASIAMAAKPDGKNETKDVIAMSNGFPSGPHFNLNIHGKKANFDGNPEPGGKSVFILEYNTSEYSESTIQYVQNKKASLETLTVLDPLAEPFDDDPAKVQLPYKVMVDEVAIPAEGYYVFARILGKPNNGKLEPVSSIILYPNVVKEACNDTDPENPGFPGYTECPEDPELMLGLIVGENIYVPDPPNQVLRRFEDPTSKGRGKSKAVDITPLFTYTGWVVDATLDIAEPYGVIDIDDVPVADYGALLPGSNHDYNNDGAEDEADVEDWLNAMEASDPQMAWYFEGEWIFNIADLVITEQGLVNDGTKLVQIRFYPVATTEFIPTPPE